MTSCHWCEKDRDDGEWLGDGWAFVCRPCIRDMGAYKRDTVFQLFVAEELNGRVDDPGGLRSDLSDAICDVLDDHGVDIDWPGWEVRE